MKTINKLQTKFFPLGSNKMCWKGLNFMMRLECEIIKVQKH